MNQSQIDEAISELVTIRDVLRWATSQLNEAKVFFGHGTDNAWDEALLIVFGILHLAHDSQPDIINARLTVSERRKLIQAFAARINQRIPAAYLIKEAWFAGLPYYVDQRVIIPRSPIAELIEQRFAPWIEPQKVHRILDLCTGSGCIAIACAWQFPEATVDALDNSDAALAVAELNINTHGVGNQVNLINSDLFANVGEQLYDIIVSNPPYVDAEDMANLPPEYLHEPSAALAAGTDGLLIVERILQEAAKHLTQHGILIVEVGNSAERLQERYPTVPFTWLEFTRGDSEVFLLTKEQLDHVR